MYLCRKFRFYVALEVETIEISLGTSPSSTPDDWFLRAQKLVITNLPRPHTAATETHTNAQCDNWAQARGPALGKEARAFSVHEYQKRLIRPISSVDVLYDTHKHVLFHTLTHTRRGTHTMSESLPTHTHTEGHTPAKNLCQNLYPASKGGSTRVSERGEVRLLGCKLDSVVVEIGGGSLFGWSDLVGSFESFGYRPDCSLGLNN